jgi:D-hydroxyproline dehydrogenase subunit gamma
MDGTVEIRVNGSWERVVAGCTVAAALLNLGHMVLRRSVQGEGRSALCGMGVCFECRVRIDGVPGRRACMEPVREGMDVVAGD